MRALACCLLLATPLLAEDFGRVLRAAKHADRRTRRAALTHLADGTVQPASRGQTEKMIRSLKVYLSPKSLGPDRALAVVAYQHMTSRRRGFCRRRLEAHVDTERAHVMDEYLAELIVRRNRS